MKRGKRVYRVAAVAGIVLALVILGGALLFASEDGLGERYDSNLDGFIDGQEAVKGVRDYFDGRIDQEQALDLVLYYFASVPVVSLSPTPTPTPTPTRTPIPTSTPVPKPGPVIASLTAGRGSFTLHWTFAQGSRVYSVDYRRVDRQRSYNRPQTSNLYYTREYLPVGRYEVRVIAWLGQGRGWSAWSDSSYVTISNIAFTPTPTPIAPRSRVCSESSSAITTIINPGEPTQMWHDNAISWGLSFTFWKQEYKSGNYSRVREAILTLKNDGSWTLKTFLSVRGNNPYSSRKTIAEGTVVLNTRWDARNEVGLKLKSTRPIQITLIVNGAELPVEIDDAGREVIQNDFTWYTSHSSGQRYIRGSGEKTASGNAVFLGFKNCYDR